MKIACRVALSGLFVLALQTCVWAQSSQPRATLVAVVDVPKVFESHPHFQSGRDAIQQQLKNAEAELARKQQELAKRSEALKNYNPGSPEYKRLEAELARLAADLQVQVRQAKKDLVQSEARQYYNTHVQILTAVERVANQNSIGLVLRFDSREIDPDNPQSVAQGVSRSVVFHRHLDITQLVVEELQRIALAQSPRENNPRR
jgi:Skp family chaperone for outer membrane proteins